MKMGSKTVFTLLAVALALPMAASAEEKAADAVKPATVAPADCKSTGKKKSATAMEKRKQLHAARQTTPGSEKIEVDNAAAHEHGRKAHGLNK
jgi:hypothetical protein